MYRYIVSFGAKGKRHSASFIKYSYAVKFFNECVAADLKNVILETVFDEVSISNEGDLYNV